ncbi:hypothetical protein B0H34DRAFT_727315 [Crassisporium funariophilum]|nr:hypothetical protein B0H34DRAFT_727315 [Crassisporium funariophilum]
MLIAFAIVYIKMLVLRTSFCSPMQITYTLRGEPSLSIGSYPVKIHKRSLAIGEAYYLLYLCIYDAGGESLIYVVFYCAIHFLPWTGSYNIGHHRDLINKFFNDYSLSRKQLLLEKQPICMPRCAWLGKLFHTRNIIFV